MQVYIIDDEEVLRDSLAWLLESRDLHCTTFASGEQFMLEFPNLPLNIPACIILDIRMEPCMSGIELFDKLAEVRQDWSILFLSGHGDIGLAVKAVKDGAFDFIEKPFADNHLVDRVFEALSISRQRVHIATQSKIIVEKLAQLSPRELNIMDRLLSGNSSREAAEYLGMGVRTVEVHRSTLFKKMGVKGAVELVNLLQILEV